MSPSPGSSALPSEPAYAERLRVPASWWLMWFGLTVTVWWIFVLATPMAFAIALAAVVGAAMAYGLWVFGVVVRVDEHGLRAGRAVIGLRHCGAARAVDVTEMSALLHAEADARAYLLLRGYVSTGVRVEVTDPDDPTPYWLISSRDPDALAAAIVHGVRRHGAEH